MEACFSQLTLDVIGKAVFNYDFDALTTSSPVIQVWLADFLHHTLHHHVLSSPLYIPCVWRVTWAHDGRKCDLIQSEAEMMLVDVLALP